MPPADIWFAVHLVVRTPLRYSRGSVNHRNLTTTIGQPALLLIPHCAVGRQISETSAKGTHCHFTKEITLSVLRIAVFAVSTTTQPH